MKVKNDPRSEFSNLSNWKIHCEDHSSLSYIELVHEFTETRIHVKLILGCVTSCVMGVFSFL